MVFAWVPLTGVAQEPAAAPNGSTSSTAQSSTARSSSPVLSWGVTEVTKLAHAKLSDTVQISFVRSSPASFTALTASEIVYLHDQGVSDGVVEVMLQQGKHERGSRTEPAGLPTAAGSANAATVNADPVTVPVYPAAPATYVTDAPTSVVYVEPAPAVVNYSYYPSYGYYYPRYGYSSYYYPSVSFGFGYRGCVRGGGYRSAPFHGRVGGHFGGGYAGGGHIGGGHPGGGPVGGGHTGGPVHGGGGGGGGRHR